MHTYRDLTPKLIYEKHENDKKTEKRQYAERVMEIEQGTFNPLVFTTTSEMAMSKLSTTTDLRS